MKHHLESTPGDADVRLVLANKYLSMDELKIARSHYAKLMLLAPNNVVALNNLAWVNLQLGNPAAALGPIERAYLLAPDDPRVIDTFGMTQLGVGNVDRAVRALRQGLDAAPNSLEIQVHLAGALAEQGHDGEARDILRQVLSENTEFPERNDAAALLEDLGG